VSSVVTNAGALAAATAAGLRAVSMRKGASGAAAAASYSRVRSGRMRGGWTAEPLGVNGARVTNPVPHTIFNEFGTYRMSAKPMARPSMTVAASA
jgi:hypothetical protein